MDQLIQCPYCGEAIELEGDESGGSSQQYVEDCQVCCKPMAVHVAVDEDGGGSIQVSRLDD